ncbi:7TM diverse intracellular signaling domain-containing protein [Ramlibacter sp.]|uniref:sensor domain-containing diguanylate cyclase n=1 Tax=Ramlibacter sp. TaxID=1917967 RepID=UPI0035B00B9B
MKDRRAWHAGVDGLRGCLSACLLAALLLVAWSAQAGTPLRLGADETRITLAGQSLFWVDERGDATFESLEAAGNTVSWQPRAAGQRDAIPGKALWIRFDAIHANGDDWFLVVDSAGVDKVGFAWRDAGGRLIRQQAGDQVPRGAWPVAGRVPAFALSSEPGRTVRYWVRIEHERVDFAAPLKLVREDALVATRESEQFLLGAYAGVAVLVVLASLAQGLLYRDRAFLAYGLYAALLGGGLLARLGVMAQHLWPAATRWNETLAAVMPTLSSVALLWFMKVVTEPARLSRVLDHMVWALLAAMLGAIALDATLGSRASLALVLAGIILILLLCTVLLVWAWRDGRDPDIRWVAIGFVPLILFALFPVARAMNLLGDSVLTRYGLFVGALVEMPVLYTVLRIRGQRRRESAVRAAALAHTDALTGLAHRPALLQRLQAALERLRQQKQACALLGVRIGNAEAIVQEFGREALDKALVVAASQLRQAVSELDVAARVGEHQFALLLEGPVTAEEAVSRAQQVVASGLRPAPALPASLTLRYLVSVVVLPHQDADAAASLAWALDGAADMAPDARKAIRPMNF